MVPIIFLDSKNKSKSAIKIFELLKEKYNTIFSDYEEIIFPEASGVKFLISVYKSFPKIKSKSGVMIISDAFRGNIKRLIPEGFYGVCSSQNDYAIDLFHSSNLRYITVGLFERDNITLSSKGEGQLVATLRVLLENLRSDVLLPSDIIVKYEGESIYSVLLCLAVLMISGEIKNLNEIIEL